uniref:Ras association domain family member 4a n=1 Tax=Callorhinchus milii TaxID=7868 RepID=A0A4W3I160_CALMI
MLTMSPFNNNLIFYEFRSELLMFLKTYNCYQEGKSFQLRQREEDGELIIEGLLNISWGLRRPIRLQMQDDNERINFSASKPWQLGPPTHSHRSVVHMISILDPQLTKADGNIVDEEVPQLMRTKSDASSLIQRRVQYRSPGERQRMKRHRFSINGHFYNHKTSVFTPSYGSVTNVRVNSAMTTPQVMNLLLNKFRVSETILHA